MGKLFLHHFVFLLPLLLLLLSLVPTHSAEMDEGDRLIRQVVADDENLLLNAEHHFTTFLQTFGQSYASLEERNHRFSVFKSNLRRSRRHQKLDPTAIHGVTQFSDLTPAEFRRKYLGLRRVTLAADVNKAPILPTSDLPSDFDWREHGAVTPVKNQGLFDSKNHEEFVYGELQNISDSCLKLCKLISSKKRKLKL